MWVFREDSPVKWGRLHARFGLPGLGSEPSIREWWSTWFKDAENRAWVIEAMIDWATYVAPEEDGPWSDVEEYVGLVLSELTRNPRACELVLAA